MRRTRFLGNLSDNDLTSLRVASRERSVSFCFFLSDGTKAEVACPPAAVGGVGAERARGHGQRGQTRGESPHKEFTVRCA